MKNLIPFSRKTVILVLTVASLSMTGTVQAHHNDNYLPLVPFILYNVLAQPRHYHEHSYTYQRGDHHENRRRHSHNRDGYRQNRLIKRNHRH